MADVESALDGDLVVVVELASLAPSVHNTQPWRFTWDGVSLGVREDADRALPVLDPTGRERIVSCGAAVLHARLAFAERGWDVATALLPDPDDPELLARLTVRGRREPTPDEHALASVIPVRSTDRDPFDSTPVAAEELELLRLAAEQEGAWARAVREDGADEAVELQVLLSHADDSQRSDPAYLAELAAWRRDREAEGVPTRALPSVPVELRGSSWVLRDFDAGKGEHGRAGAEPPPAEHPTVVVVGTEADERSDWLTAGQALGRLLLQATVTGLAVQPMTQVLEVPVLRARMRHVLGVVGHPQMLLRVGHGRSAPVSPRRPAAQTITLVDPPPA
jgi:nitroreductase